MINNDLRSDERCGYCHHTGFVHYAAGGCTVAGCDCQRVGTWGPNPNQKRLG